jgi:SMODS-associated NUDIX domain
MDIPTPTGALLSLARAAITHQDHFIPLARSYKFIFRKRIRVSMACLIRFEVQNKQILLQNRLRPESIAPFGGVIKYHDAARGLLDSIEYEDEAMASCDSDLNCDLRGYFPATKFGTFLTWFKSRTGREQTEAVTRELQEEFKDANIPAAIATPLCDAKYSLFRTIHEGPYAHDHHDYATFRYFELYRPNACRSVETALDELVALTKGNSSLVHLATKDEIFNLRSRAKKQIAGTARYFYTSKWHGYEPPSF